MVKLAPLETTVVEPVGIAYLQNSLFFEQNVKENNNANGDNNDSATNDADAIEDEEVEFELEEWEETRRPTEGKNKGKTIRYKKFNYYKALGLKNEWRSTDAQIKKNYQKGILKFHPDKIGGDEKDPMFLKIQEAYQNLIDPQKKKIMIRIMNLMILYQKLFGKMKSIFSNILLLRLNAMLGSVLLYQCQNLVI